MVRCKKDEVTLRSLWAHITCLFYISGLTSESTVRGLLPSVPTPNPSLGKDLTPFLGGQHKDLTPSLRPPVILDHQGALRDLGRFRPVLRVCQDEKRVTLDQVLLEGLGGKGVDV